MHANRKPRLSTICSGCTIPLLAASVELGVAPPASGVSPDHGCQTVAPCPDLDDPVDEIPGLGQDVTGTCECVDALHAGPLLGRPVPASYALHGAARHLYLLAPCHGPPTPPRA